MKKGFFATIAMFTSLVLVACGGGGTKKCEDGKHKFGKWEVVTPATCKVVGQSERTCTVCGEKETKEIAKTDHTWNEGVVTQEATCTVPGVKTYTCTVCQETKTEEIKADHVWGTPESFEGAADEAAYNVFTCSLCGLKKIEFAAKQADGKATISGGLKSDTSFPDYMKLNTNLDSITYKFSYAGNAVTNATIYQRGVMDYWHDGNNDNQTRNYYSGKNSTDGNFKLTVNDVDVDYSATANLTYEDLLPGEAQGSYSALGDAIIGACAINNGENTITYQRTESYNMLIKDFVIILG